MKKRILVTGGAGDLGHRICKALSENGFEAIALDNLSQNNDSNVKWGPLIKRDVRETGPVAQALKKDQISLVIHCAGLSETAAQNKAPEDIYDINLIGGMSLLQAMQKSGVKKLIFASASGDKAPHSKAQLMLEDVIKDCSSAYGLNSSIIKSNRETDFLNAAIQMLST